MSSLSVLNNIDLIEKQVQQLKIQKQDIDKELLRQEGSLRVFQQLKSVGIEEIKVPQDIIENTEVIEVRNDTIPSGEISNEIGETGE